MKYILLCFFSILQITATGQVQPKEKLATGKGRVKICLGNDPNNPKTYCWENLEVDMILNPVTGDFSISVPSEIFRLDTARYDSVPHQATVALRQAPKFVYSGNTRWQRQPDLDSFGEYPVELTGDLVHGDTIVDAALNATLYISENDHILRAQVPFTTQDFNINFFEKFGLIEDRMMLWLEIYLVRK